jgi:hypothetical protein
MTTAELVSPAGDASQDPEIAYYQAVEEHFVSLRGDPLFLSNADWLLIRRWKTMGIPLRVVLRGIKDALDSHAHSFRRNEKVASLRYCSSEVEAAHERWHKALRPGSGKADRVSARLSQLASVLDAAAEADERIRAACVRVRAAIESRAVSPGKPEACEAWLRRQETALVKELRRIIGSGWEEIAGEVDADLAPYVGRMPTAVLDRVRAESITRRALEAFGLPRLSLLESE